MSDACSDPEQSGPWKFASEHKYPFDAVPEAVRVSVSLEWWSTESYRTIALL